MRDRDALYRRVAWCSVDKNSAVWVSSIPTRHLRAGPAEFREICASYFGVPSPIATALEGQVIYSKDGTRRGVCDKFGLMLVSLRLDGHWNSAHDKEKFAIAQGLGARPGPLAIARTSEPTTTTANSKKRGKKTGFLLGH